MLDSARKLSFSPFKTPVRHESLYVTLRRIALHLNNCLSFDRCVVFSNKNIGEKVVDINVNHSSLSQKSLTIFNTPIIKKTVVEDAPVFIKKVTSNDFPKSCIDIMDLKSLLILPIASKNQLFGIILLDKNMGYFNLDPKLIDIADQMCKNIASQLEGGRNKDILSYLNGISTMKLSPREIQVLQLISFGLSLKDIATMLHISEFTVRDHFLNAKKKLDSKNRIHAISESLRLNIIV